MAINLQTGAFIVPQTLPGARSADTQVVQKQQTDTYPAPAPTQDETDFFPVPTPSVEDKRYDQVFNASKSLFKDVYAVTDTSFTIFKDESGQYITRYTSLRDGRVTYVPEPKLLQLFESSLKTRSAVIELQA
ncbi:MAG: hypothetical protein V4735_02505 [Pseudomonadota bacterium]